MTAYELADEVDLIAKNWLGQNKSGKLSTMLRQQADRIAELEKDLHMIERHYDQLEDYTGEVDNGVKFVGTLPDGHPLKMSKPVAWWDGKHFADKHKSDLADIPLYTHPVKQLSDEEIKRLAYQHRYSSDENFARAIIKEITE